MTRPSPGLERALARAEDGACVLDERGHIVRWNAAAQRLLGYTAGEVLGRLWEDMLAATDGASPRCVEALARAKDARPVWLHVEELEGAGGGGERVRLRLFRDVTATRELVELLGSPPSDADAGAEHATGPLSPREVQVLRLVAEGVRTPAIARRLGISRATVRNHIQNILAKLGVHTRLAAVVHAARLRIIPPPGVPSRPATPTGGSR